MQNKQVIIFAVIGIFVAGIVTTIPYVESSSNPSSAFQTGRFFDYSIVKNQNGTYTETTNLPQWVQDYVADNGTQIFSPYKLSSGAGYYTYESGQVTFTFNTNSCNISIFNNGRLDGTPAVVGYDSYTLKSAVNGTSNWLAMNPLNNSTCNPSMIENSTGVFMIGNKYVAGLANFTQIWSVTKEHSLEAILIAKNLNAGANDHKFGYSETLQIPRIIQIGNTTVDFALGNGTTLTRDWILSHQNAVMSIGKSIRYDFGLGLDYVTNIQIKWDGVNANLIINYLNANQPTPNGSTQVIDPLLGIQQNGLEMVTTTTNTGVNCPASGSTYSQTTFNTIQTQSATSSSCSYTFSQFNIAPLKSAVIKNIVFRYDASGISNAKNCDFVPVTHDLFSPSTTLTNLVSDAQGSAYVTNNSTCTTAGTGKLVSLGATAVSDLQTKVNSNNGYFYGVATRFTGSRDGSDHQFTLANPELLITYAPASYPSKPTNAVLSPNENSFTLSWSNPIDNGGTAVTKYSVTNSNNNSRTFWGEQLPDNNTHDNMTYPKALDFSHSTTMLLHFNDANFTSIKDSSGNNRSVRSGDSFFEDQYNASSYWTALGTKVTVNDPSFIGVLKFNVAPNGADNRVYRSLGTTLSNSNFILQTDFAPTAQATAFHPIIVLSNNTNNPTTSSVIEELGVVYKSGNLSPFYKDGSGAFTSGTNITASAGTSTYHIILKRTSTTSQTLMVCNDADCQSQVSGSPVTQVIPANVKGLNTLQHSVRSSGSAGSTLTGTIDNTVLSVSSSSIVWGTRQPNSVMKYGTWLDGIQGFYNVTTNNNLGFQDYNDFTIGIVFSNETLSTTNELFSMKKTGSLDNRLMVNSTGIAFYTDSNTLVVGGAYKTNILSGGNIMDDFKKLVYHAGTSNLPNNWVATVGSVEFNPLKGWMNMSNIGGGSSDSRAIPTINSTYWTQMFTITPISHGTYGNLAQTVGTHQIGLWSDTVDGKLAVCVACNAGSRTYFSPSVTTTLGVPYYFTETKSGTNVTLSVYSDMARTNLLGTVSDNSAGYTEGTVNQYYAGSSYSGSSVPNVIFSSWSLHSGKGMPPFANHFHTLILTRGGDVWRIYYDGVQLGNNVTNHISVGSSPFAVIGANSTGTGSFTGTIYDEMFILNRTITTQEVSNFQNRISSNSGLDGNVMNGYKWVANTASNSYTDGNKTDNASIPDGKTICYRVTGMNANVNGSSTNQLCDHTWTIPNPPTGLNSTRVSNSQINLVENAPSYKGGTGASILGYYVKRQNGTDQKFYIQPFIRDQYSRFMFDTDALKDVGIKGNNPTLMAGHTNITSGMINKAFSFDGSSYLSVPNQADYTFDRNTPKSFSGWFKTSTLSNQLIIAKGATLGINEDGWQIFLDSTGGIQYSESNPLGSALLDVRTFGTNYANGKWQHFMIIDNGSSTASGIKIYVNGTLKTLAVNSDTLTGVSILNSKPVTIGAGDGGSAKFTGLLDDIIIYNSTRTTIDASNSANYRFMTTTSLSDTNLLRFTTYNYKATAINVIGRSSDSSVTSATTFDTPTAPVLNNCVSYFVGNITCNWSIPSDNGGSSITSYQVSRNGTIFVNSTGNTNLKWVDTTSYSNNKTETYCIHAWNIFGNSTCSNSIVVKTSEATKGTFSMNATTVGDAFGTTGKFNLTLGLPLPTIKWVALLNGSIVKTNQTLNVTPSKYIPYYFPIQYDATLGDSNSTYVLKMGITNGSGISVMTSNSSITHRVFVPQYHQNNGFTFNDTGKRFNSNVNVQVNVTRNAMDWQIECHYFTNIDPIGYWINKTHVSYYSITTTHNPSDNVYVRCYNDNTMFTLVFQGDALYSLQNALNAIHTTMGDWLGVPMAFLFVLMIAGIGTKEDEPRNIIIILIVLGIFSVLGLLTMSTGTWALIMIIGTVAVLGSRMYPQ